MENVEPLHETKDLAAARIPFRAFRAFRALFAKIFAAGIGVVPGGPTLSPRWRYTIHAMPLTPELRKFLRDLFQFLELQPIEHTDPRYVPLYESLEDGDPVERLSRTIIFSETQSCQFFSGFRGTGKSTQLAGVPTAAERRCSRGTPCGHSPGRRWSDVYHGAG